MPTVFIVDLTGQTADRLSSILSAVGAPPNGETPGANSFCADAPLQQWLSSFQAARRQFMDMIVPGLATHY